jgi:TolA-binding protein
MHTSKFIQRLISYVVASAILVAAWGVERAQAITKGEIVTLTKLGINKAEIIKAIKKDRTIFKLPVLEILKLKKSGVHQDVIKFMLETPQKFGKKKDGTATTDTATTDTTETREMTAEEKAAEDERLQREAQRLAEEAQRAQDAQRRAYAQGVLRQGKELAESGAFEASIQSFQKFLSQGGFAPGSEEYIIARYGVANALVRAGLHQSAAEILMEVLLTSLQRKMADPSYGAPFFQSAFNDLRKLRQLVGFSAPEIGQLAQFDVSKYSQTFRDSFHYVLGEFFFESGSFDEGNRYFERLSDKSPDYAKTLYLKGVLEIDNQLYASAARSMQSAIIFAEKNGTDEALIELGYLALARIAYTNHDYYAAVFYYRKIDIDSVRAPIAFYESSWSYFLNGDSVRALGMFHALHSPALNHFFYPELWILEATIYLNTCHYKESRSALNMFNREVAVLATPLKLFVKKNRNPVKTYDGIIKTISGDKSYDLPSVLTRPLLADVDFHNLYRGIRQIEKEEKIIRGSKLGSLGKTLLSKLSMARQNTVVRAGIRAQVLLNQLVGQIDKFSINVTEMEIDLSNIEIEAIDEETRRLMDAKAEEAKAQEAAARGALAIVGADSMAWPFEGEYWVDEIPYYRALLQDRCVK